MKNEVLRTYKFYDEKGRRISIFGKELEDGKMEIFVLTCSKSDQFSKKLARQYYETAKNSNGYYICTGQDKTDYIIHPLVYIIPVMEGKPKFTFIALCKKNFYRLQTYTTKVDVEKTALVKYNVFSLNKIAQ